MSKKNRIFIYAGIVIVLLILIIPKLRISSDPAENQGRRSDKPVSVNAIVIKPRPLENKIFSNGTVIGNEEVELRSEISGKIVKILFEEGSKVKEGNLLIKINDSELQATLKKNVLREALAKDKEFRLRQMLEKNLTSQQEYDIALNELDLVKADIEFTKAQIEKTEISAPFDGVIGLRNVSVGSYISPQTKIATLQSLNPIKVDFSVPQKYYGEVSQGKTVNFKLPATGRIFKGKIYAVEPKVDQNTRTLQVRATAQNDNYELVPGAYVEIEIILQEIKNSILVPTETIVPDMEGEKVFLYKNGMAVSQPVTTGIRTASDIQILSGVVPGDTLISSGIIQVRPNSPVNIKIVE